MPPSFRSTVPLTPSHAAAALPFSRVAPALPTSALIVGCLAPDFEYLLRLAPRGTLGHSLLGSFTFCLPLGLAAYVVYETRIRTMLTQRLPRRFANLFSSSSLRLQELRSWLLAAIAIWVGAASHIVWDSFTHAHGLGVAHLALLRDPIFPAVFPRLLWYKALQHGSTVIGAFIVVTWGWSRIRREPPSVHSHSDSRDELRFVVGVLGVAAGLGVLNGLRVARTGFANMLGHTAVGAMSALALLLVVLSMLPQRLRH